MLQAALKEWAVICAALAGGRQALLLRKGGIAEQTGTFQIEHTRFWLYPTYVHQQEDGIQPEARPLLENVLAERPPQGTVRLSHFAEITGVYFVKELLPAQMLAHLHLWSDGTVEQRFAYRYPGLFVLPVRVYRVPRAFAISDTITYQGCRSWVELDSPLPTAGAEAVLGDGKMHELIQSLDLLLNPTALV
jgi:hypothetical protein